jgi:hypothetical protein
VLLVWRSRKANKKNVKKKKQERINLKRLHNSRMHVLEANTNKVTKRKSGGGEGIEIT